MQSTVLAGPVEFSPADIALVVAVLAGLFVVVTAPGWAVLGWAARRRRLARGPGSGWASALGGSVAGLLLCATTSAAVGVLLGAIGAGGLVVGVPACWAVCWAVAAALRPAPAGTRDRATGSAGAEQGWGR